MQQPVPNNVITYKTAALAGMAHELHYQGRILAKGTILYIFY
jgi:hypothetical protein